MTSEYAILTVNEVSEMLHVHPYTLYRLVRAGKVPAFRIGGDWRFQRDVLEHWIAEQTKLPKQPGRRGRPARRPSKK